MNDTSGPPGSITHAEILQQPELWPVTVDIVNRRRSALNRLSRPAVITGAGSSAYAASAIAASWEDASAIPTTDLLLDPQRYFTRARSLVSIARSGDSPESAAVVRSVQKYFPQAHQLAITCNAEGTLAHLQRVNTIVLDPRTNDRSLVMTSSFSNLTLAGVYLENGSALLEQVPKISKRVASQMEELEQRARELAGVDGVSRMVALGSGPLFSIAREAALKVMEMTAGQCVAIPETYLGLRHGPMSFLRHDSLVLCFLSSDPKRRKYEEDLIAELGRKELGEIIVIASDKRDEQGVHAIPANAPDLPDSLRTPFEIVFPQLLAYHLSLRAGLNPDNPSPAAVITRVVQGVEIHDD